MRARNYKPGFFKNEELLDCDPLARILFLGLIALADREGRLEDRPRRFKLEILPADNCDIEALLVQLEKTARVITRYHGVDCNIIQVKNFKKHQKPHVNEVKSVLPSIDECTCDQGRKHLALNPSSLKDESLSLLEPSKVVRALEDKGKFNPGFHPELEPVAKRVLDVYSATVKSGHSAGRRAAISIMKILDECPAISEADLERAIRQYAMVCDANGKTKRFAPATFFDEQHWQEFLTSPPVSQDAADTRKPLTDAELEKAIS